MKKSEFINNYRRQLFLTLCLTPIILKKTDLIGNWTTFFLALIPISIVVALEFIFSEAGVAVDFDDPKPKQKKGIIGLYNKTGRFGQLLLLTSIGTGALFLAGFQAPIAGFISLFITFFTVIYL